MASKIKKKITKKSQRHVGVTKVGTSIKIPQKFHICWLNFKAQATETLRRTGTGTLPLKAVSVHNTERGSLTKRSGCSNHTSKLQRKLSATPTGTQLGSGQNKLGIKHKCPDLELDMAKVFVLEGEKESKTEPSSKAVLWISADRVWGSSLKAGTKKGPTLAPTPGFVLPNLQWVTYHPASAPSKNWSVKAQWGRKGLRRPTWQGLRSQKVKITLWHEAKSRLQSLSLLCEFSLCAVKDLIAVKPDTCFSLQLLEQYAIKKINQTRSPNARKIIIELQYRAMQFILHRWWEIDLTMPTESPLAA